MKELKRKTNLTLIAILSMILLVVLVFLNVHSYNREKEDIRRSLNILDSRMGPAEPGKESVPDSFGNNPDPAGIPEKPAMEGVPEQEIYGTEPRRMENMMILDHELYTVDIQDGAIAGIYSLGETSEDFDVNKAADRIIAKEKNNALSVGNLYFGGYSYQYHYMDSIVILNNGDITKKLWELFFESAILFIIFELIIILASVRITRWITKPAEEAFARQKEFIADASHELKTPLAVIMASADEMQAKADDEKYLENIRYESDRMNRLIAGLLNLSRLDDAEAVSLHKEEDLSRILEKNCMAFDGVAFEQGVIICTEIEKNLVYKCNKEEIEQMVTTILDNAVRHSFKDTQVRVKAGRNNRKNAVSIQVINTGTPIPDEDREKIFERFYRGDKARSRDENHYGLGLAIARRIARNHNGDIRAYSENGDTVFDIELR